RLRTLAEERKSIIAAARVDFASEQMGQTGRYLLAAYKGDTPETSANEPPLDADVLRRWVAALDRDVTPALLQVEENFQQTPGLLSRIDTEATPTAVGNASGAEVRFSGITLPDKSIAVHPGPTEGIGIGWRAPVAASVVLSGRLVDADAKCGDGVQWSIVYRESGTERVIAEGQFENGGTSPINIATPFAVQAGGQLLLNVFPGNGHGCDTTQVDLTITSDTGTIWDFVGEVLPHFGERSPWPDSAGNPGVWWLYRHAGQSLLDPVLFASWWAAQREVEEGGADSDAIKKAAAVIQAAVDTARDDTASSLRGATNRWADSGGPYWLESVSDPRLDAIAEEIEELNAKVAQPLDRAIGIQEGGVPDTEYAGFHDVRVHRRGEYTNLGDVVPRQMPAILTGTSPRMVTAGSGRGDLAQWLTEDCDALLARVMVNRVWQHHFGEGLVRTPGDFGAQGQAPTHPELLDYLAARCIESGWSLKALHRMILNSEAYQRSSNATEAQLELDPENRLLARMNRRRLDAESLRDSLLFVTDRLDTTPGGPAYVVLDTPRRTLYLRTVRSNTSTFVTLFDGADATSVVPRRNESTVSPQALFLMNHPFALAASEALASTTGAATSPVEAMYRRLYGRPPTEDERTFAQATLAQMGGSDPTEARAAFAQILLSSNEFYFID
ncbi:MAG: DUF1553 domain-containing protein, partial [Candidatus Hydrogenedentes bacterium]|nr:DUF1553 domain-containing protein [Candidatus Hydrogenedentota bacterium]